MICQCPGKPPLKDLAEIVGMPRTAKFNGAKRCGWMLYEFKFVLMVQKSGVVVGMSVISESFPSLFHTIHEVFYLHVPSTSPRYRENAQSPSWQKPPGRPEKKNMDQNTGMSSRKNATCSLNHVWVPSSKHWMNALIISSTQPRLASPTELSLKCEKVSWTALAVALTQGELPFPTTKFQPSFWISDTISVRTQRAKPSITTRSKELKGDVTFDELMKRTTRAGWEDTGFVTRQVTTGPIGVFFKREIFESSDPKSKRSCADPLPGIEMNMTQIPCTIQAFMNEKNLPLMSS